MDVKTIVFKLLPNEHFDYVNGDGQYFTCTLSNKNYKPRYWDNDNSGIAYTSYFGLYSNNKFEFMHDVLYNYYGIDYVTWEIGYVYRQYATLEGIRAIGRSIDQLNNLQGLLHEEYQNRTKGYYDYDGTWMPPTMEPIYDENTGKEIQFSY